jgi:signal transduction histidine kinase/CheY-like chemotaxis protein
MDPALLHLLDALPEPSFLVEGTGTVRAANPAAGRLCAAVPQELVGRSLGSLVRDHPERVANYLRLCSRSRQPVPGALAWPDDGRGPAQLRCDGMVLIPRDGGEAPVLFIRCRPRAEATDPFVLLNQKIEALSREIVERKKIQRQRDELLQSERAARLDAERNSRMKDEFLATLSHELRTPLNAIMGWAHLLSRPHDAEMAAEGIEVIARNASLQAELISDLLDMSRIISGKVRLHLKRTDLAEVIEAAVQSIRPTAETKNIRLQVACDPLAGPVRADPDRLQQVVWNLLTNAVKFTPKGGRVQVLLERVNSHVEISVRDTGLGIRPDFLPHVFERFRQADATMTRRVGGLGLGLSIVKQLVELHGGTVHAKSRGENQGSTFIVMLPLLILDDEATASPDALPRRPSQADRGDPSGEIDFCGVRILVVDDEPDARELVHRILAEHGAVVDSVASASDAFERLGSARFDLIISDIGMPDMDGYEMMRRIRALPDEQGGRTPAMALSAFARAEDRTRAMHAGYGVHLSKPLDYAEFIATAASLSGRIRPR